MNHIGPQVSSALFAGGLSPVRLASAQVNCEAYELQRDPRYGTDCYP